MNFLPGWFPAGAVIDAQITLTQVLSSAGQTTVTIPNGVVAGDIIILGALGQSGTTDTPDFTDPSGFTLLASQNGTVDGRALRCRIFGKIADGSEDGTNITVFTDSDDERTGHCVVFRPNKPVLSLSAVDDDSVLSDGDPGDVTIGTGLQYNLALTLFSGFSVGAVDISSRSSTPSQDGENTATSSGFGNLATAFRWHMWNPRSIAQAVTSGLGDTGSASAMTSVAVSLT